jgi:pimeloyl-ACP methyl ester carboxylesterase
MRSNFVATAVAASTMWMTGITDACAACQATRRSENWVQGEKLCLAMQTYGTETAGSAPTLIVLLHGDVSSGGPADYLYSAAKRLARPGVVAVALLRPGYADAAGKTSEGTHHDRRDHYTPTNIASVGAAVEALKARYSARAVIIVGHSGGAATAGVLIGQRPGLAGAAVLVSCPCDIPRWRRARGRGAWTHSLSPHAFIARVSPATTVVAITGSADDNTSPTLARDYVAALAKRGVPAHFQQTGGGHSYRDLADPVAATVEALLSHLASNH